MLPMNAHFFYTAANQVTFLEELDSVVGDGKFFLRIGNSNWINFSRMKTETPNSEPHNFHSRGADDCVSLVD